MPLFQNDSSSSVVKFHEPAHTEATFAPITTANLSCMIAPRLPS